MDLLKCQEMVSGVIKDLKYIQRDMDGIIKSTKSFICEMTEKLDTVKIDGVVIETELPKIRSRKRKILDGEKNND